MTLTGRTAAVALACAVVVLAGPGTAVLVAVNAVLLAGIAADLLLAAPVRTLRLTRGGDVQVRLGGTASVLLTITNPARRRLRAAVLDNWQPSAGVSPRHHRLRVPGGGQAAVAFTLTPARRGDKATAGVTVRSFGPLGLAARQRQLPAPWSVRALPPFRSRRHLPGKLSRLRELEGQHRSLQRGQGSEFDSLREYVIGDDVRSIDWRATARRGDVAVRTWRPERDRRILIVLDTGRTAAGRVGGYPRLDVSMDAALLLTALASRAGDRVDFLAFDRQPRARVTGAARPAVLASVTSAMAALEPALIEVDAAAMTAAVAALTRRRSLVVLLTDLNPAAIEEGLLPRLPLLAAQNQLLLAAVSVPRLAEMAAARADAADVYAAAAAQRAGAERARIAALLGRHGVQVVDAQPAQFPAALADAYIALKSAGRL